MVAETSDTRQLYLRSQGLALEYSSQYWGCDTDFYYQQPSHNLIFRIFPHRMKLVECRDDGIRGQFGSLMFFPAQSITRAKADEPEIAKLLIIRFTDSWLRLTMGCDVDLNVMESCTDLTCGRLASSIQRLVNEVHVPGLGSQALMKALAESAVIDLVRALSPRAASVGDQGRLLSSAQMREIDEYIHGRKIADVRVSGIADYLGISSSHLRRLFKSTTGMTLQEHIEELKKMRAIEFVANTPMPLKLIAYELGFEQVNAFSAAFKRLTNLTPGDLRRRSKQ